MGGWTWVVEATGDLIGWVGQVLGLPSGPAIFVATALVRALLVPLTYPLAVRTRAWQRAQRPLRPQIKEMRRKYRDDPKRSMDEVKRLHTEAGIKMVDMGGLVGALIQLPVLIAFFQAVLDMTAEPAGIWIGLALGVAAGVLSGLGTWLGGQTQSRIFLGVAAVLPVAIVLWLGAGIGYYLVAFYGVQAFQSILIRRAHGP